MKENNQNLEEKILRLPSWIKFPISKASEFEKIQTIIKNSNIIKNQKRDKVRGETYEEFINNNFKRIVDAFEMNGYVVENRKDIDTYPYWMKRDRQVHWNERSTLLISDKPAPQVVYINGHTVLDERTGRPKIRTFKKRYYSVFSFGMEALT